MVTGIYRLQLSIPAHSLKEKRHFLSGIIRKIQNKYNVSIAEVEKQDLWQIAELGIAVISNEEKIVIRIFQQIANDIEKKGELEILQVDKEMFYS